MVGTCFNFSAYIYDDFINRNVMFYWNWKSCWIFDLRDRRVTFSKQLKTEMSIYVLSTTHMWMDINLWRSKYFLILWCKMFYLLQVQWLANTNSIRCIGEHSVESNILIKYLTCSVAFSSIHSLSSRKR